MRWRKKSNSAWALIVPNIDNYSFLPLYKTIGKEGVLSLFKLNLKWQRDNLNFIKTELDQNADFFFFAYPNSILNNILTKDVWPYKVFLKMRPAGSREIDFKSVSDTLIKSYDRITIWNIESLLISPEHFLRAARHSGIFMLKNFRERMLFVSYNTGNYPAEKEINHENDIIPSIYDLESLRESIAYFYRQKTSLSEIRSRELAEILDFIRRNPY